MKKILSMILAFAMIITSVNVTFNATEVKALNAFPSNSKITDVDFLKANGKVLKNNYGNGDTIYLRGTNAGGLAVQEMWMNPTFGADDQMGIINTLTNRFGADRARTLIKKYMSTYWTAEDFDRCASIGINCVRLPVWYRDFVDANNNWYSDAFSYTDWFIEEAGKRGIYVVFDMHGAYGSQNGSDHSGVDGKDAKESASRFFFGSEAASNQEKYYQMWEKIAEHYKGNPIVAGYDLLNEPYCTYRYNSSYSENDLHIWLWNIYDHAYDRIRAIDPNHVIIMEATWDSKDLPNPSDYGWSNVMYEYHQYEYSNYSNEDNKQITSLHNKIKNIFDKNHNVPSYLGEFNLFNSDSAWRTGLQLLNDNGLSWTTWTFKTPYSNDNWGLWRYNGVNVNVATQSYDEIYNNWGVANNYAENTYMTNVLKDFTPGTVKEKNNTVVDAIGRHEAENANMFVQGSAGEAYSIQNSGNYSNGKAIGNMNTWNGDNNERSYCQTKVNASAGTYKMTIGYSGGDYANNRSSQIDIRINGGAWRTITAAPTSAWDVVGTVELEVDLNAGVNTIDVTGARNVWYGEGQEWQWFNLDYFDLAAKNQPQPEGKIQIEGYQISHVGKGHRVVASVEPSFSGKTVQRRGIVYGLSKNNGKSTGISANDLKINSTNTYVRNFDSTVNGVISTRLGESSTATYYAMTMEFGQMTVPAFTAEYIIKAYAVLSDGTVVYSEPVSYNVYNVADYIYQNVLSTSNDGHEYLYNNILKVVTPNYGKKDYVWSNTIVNAGLIK